MPALSRLESLPAELLDRIAGLIEDNRSLLHLATTSKTLNQYANPYIYSSYTNAVLRKRQHGTPHAVISFMRAITRKPHLAACCKHIDIEFWEWWKPKAAHPFLGSLWRSGALDDDSVALFRQWAYAANMFDKDFEDDFDASIESGSGAAIASILLAHLHRVETIRFCGPTAGAELECFAWNLHLARTGHQFQYLRELSCVGHSLVCDWTIGDMSFFFRLPSLRIFTGEVIREEPDIRHWSCPPAMSSVTTLRLRRCVLSLKALRTFVISCKTLEEFEYSDGTTMEMENDDDSRDPFKASELVDVLECQKDSLKSFSFCLLSDPKRDYALDSSMISSMRAFSQLKEVRIDDCQLRGDSREHPIPLADLLPPSLVSLSVINPMSGWPFIELATSGRENCPHLKQVELGYEDFPHQDSPFLRFISPNGYAEMKSAFSSADIELCHFDSDEFKWSLVTVEDLSDYELSSDILEERRIDQEIANGALGW